MKKFCLLALISVSLPLAIHAAPSVGSITAPAGYFAAINGVWNGGGGWPGDNQENGMTAGSHDAQWQIFTNLLGGNASGSYSGGSITSSSQGVANFGFVQMSSSATWPNSTFTRGGGAGGWTDKLTISSPGLSGQNGTLIFLVDAAGVLGASGFSGASHVNVTPYLNKALVAQSSQFTAAIALIGGVGFGTDRQSKQWSLTSTNAYITQNFGATILFTVPFVFGTQFELSVFARGYASSRSSSGVGGLSGGTVNVNHVSWAGIQSVLQGTNTVSSYTVASLSGRNWNAPFPARLSGVVNLGSYVGDPDLETVDIQIRNGGGTVLETFPGVPLGPGGSYSLEVPYFGTYTVAVRGRTWVRRATTGITLASGVTTTQNFSLSNGDADLSGEVDAVDIDLVISKFGSVNGDPGFNPNADLDGSGEVDAVDIDVAIGNFGAADE